VGVGIAESFGRRRDCGNPAAALAAHLGDQSRAARTVVLVTVVHRWDCVARRGKTPL
jgi:hypothetical protein